LICFTERNQAERYLAGITPATAEYR